MNAQFMEYLALEIEMDRRGQPLSGRGKNRYAVDIGPRVEKMGGPLNDPLARSHPLVERLVTSILGAWRYGKIIVECPCKDSEYMGWHVDTFNAQRPDLSRPKGITVLKFHIPLVDVHEKNGPMEVIPGSHRMDYVEGDEAIKRLPRLYTTPILMKKGDGLLRDGDLIHRGTPNLSDNPRPLYSRIYKVVDPAELHGR
jgi:phytanoyl-CoA dioxygenase PhyH